MVRSLRVSCDEFGHITAPGLAAEVVQVEKFLLVADHGAHVLLGKIICEHGAQLARLFLALY